MKAYPQSFIDFAKREMQVRPTTIKHWSEQTDDKLLALLAKDVVEASQSCAEHGT